MFFLYSEVFNPKYYALVASVSINFKNLFGQREMDNTRRRQWRKETADRVHAPDNAIRLAYVSDPGDHFLRKCTRNVAVECIYSNFYF
jgi:hypothetical protein